MKLLPNNPYTRQYYQLLGFLILTVFVPALILFCQYAHKYQQERLQQPQHQEMHSQ